MPAPAVPSLRLARPASAGGVHAKNGGGGGELVLKNLAEQLLTSDEELWTFKQSLQHFRVTRSVPSLCTALRPLITCTERLMLLVELANHLPTEPLRRDFQKLCTLEFPKYHTFLRYFTPQPVTDGSKVIAQDASGQLLVANKVFEKNVYTAQTNGTMTSEPRHDAESGFYSEQDDLSRHGNGRGSVSSWAAAAAAATTPTTPSESAPATLHRHPRSPVKHQFQSQRAPSSAKPSKQRHSLGGILGSGPLKILSGSFQSLSFGGKKHRRQLGDRPPEMDSDPEEPNGPDHLETSRTGQRQKRILLARRSDGSLGVGIKGGKEYGTPIVVYMVEDGCQAQQQGLHIGDLILDVNGTDFTHLTHAEAVTLMRNAWNVIMTVQSPDTAAAAAERFNRLGSGAQTEDGPVSTELDIIVYPSSSGKLGCAVNRDIDTGEVVVKTVEKNSSAGKAGLLTADVIVQIDGMPVNSLSEKQIATLTNSKRVRLRLRRLLSHDKTIEISTARSRSRKDTTMSEDVFSPLDFSSPVEGGDTDQEMFTFAASTPRALVAPNTRSRSEERALSPDPHHLHHHQPYSIPITPPAPDMQTADLQTDVLAPVALRDMVPRMYRPRTMAVPSSSSTSHHHHHPNSGTTTTRNSGMYNSVTRGRAPVRQPPPHHHHNNHRHQQRYTIVYSVRGRSADTIVHQELLPPSSGSRRQSRPSQQQGHHHHQQSGTQPRHGSKMRYIRNRSRSRERERGTLSVAERDLLQAVQSGVEKRQRALRLSLYQVADDGDDDWRI
ncbi:uncharacterized protein LOC143284923 isoform X2 [Babylonia areolata]